MAGKFASTCTKAVAVVFTAVVAPVLVHNATKNDKVNDTAAAQPAAVPPAPKSPAQPDARTGEPARTVAVRAPAAPARPSPPEPPALPAVAQVIVTGVGKTPDEALRDAFNTALYRAAVAQVDPATWAAHARELWDGLGSDGGDLIRGWKDLGTKKEWTLRGTVHHREVAVDVDRSTLVQRLQAVPIPNPPRRRVP